MKRRQFITLLGGAAALPLTARAQQSVMPVVGFLSSASPELWASRARAFRQGLSETGYDAGRNVAIEYHWANGQYDRLPELAADLVRHQVAVIVANGPAALAANAATTTIPIVFLTGFDPVPFGLVASLNRPGGNLTGVSNLNVELGPKRLELLHELLPTATVVAFLVNQSNPNAESQTRDLQAAARSLGLQLHVLQASTERDFELAFATLGDLRAGALIFGTDGFFISQSKKLAALTVRYAVPAIFQSREFTAAGGLMSYGGSVIDGFRLMGIYAGRILKGEKPADLPVIQSAKVELFINLKTAKALGINFPLPLVGRADEVIE
jgi:ABC-type uncharacterized transport system substrate-binding protein